MLPHDLAAGTEDPDGDRERRHLPGQRRAAGGLGEHQVAGHGVGVDPFVVELGGRGQAVAQDAEARSRDWMKDVGITARCCFITPVPEEGQVSGGEPVEEVGRLRHLLGRPGGQRRTQFRCDHGGRTDEGRRVGDDGPDRLQGGVQGGLDGLGPFRIGKPVDQDVHPGFPDAVLRVEAAAGLADHLEQFAAGVAPDGQDGMQDAMDGDARSGDRADDGLDHVRHVVVDDVDHRRGGRPSAGAAVQTDTRIEDPDRGGPWLPDAGHPQMAVDDAQHVLRVAGAILLGDVGVVGLEQRGVLRPQQ